VRFGVRDPGHRPAGAVFAVNEEPEGSSENRPNGEREAGSPPSAPEADTPPDGPEAGEEESFQEQKRDEFRERASELVDKIQQGGADGPGSRRGLRTCAGCLLLFVLLAGISSYYLYSVVQDHIARQPDTPSEIESAARDIMDFRLPGGSRGRHLIRDHLRLAVVDSRGGEPSVRLILYRFPGGWPRRLNDLFLRLSGTYWQMQEDLTLEPFRRDRRPICGQSVLVESARGESSGGVQASVRRGCVVRDEDILCATVIARGDRPGEATSGVLNTLSCP